MSIFNNRWTFAASVLLGVMVTLSTAAYTRWKHPPALLIKQLTPEVSITGQIEPRTIASLKAQGFSTIINLRPDGEAIDQASSKEVEKEVKRNGMQFFYVPVPHSEIPENAVDQLSAALSKAAHPILLYCRSGSRAARTWSLVEASRPDGLSAESIQAAVRVSGQSADDLNYSIAQRIAQRKSMERRDD